MRARLTDTLTALLVWLVACCLGCGAPGPAARPDTTRTASALRPALPSTLAPRALVALPAPNRVTGAPGDTLRIVVGADRKLHVRRWRARSDLAVLDSALVAVAPPALPPLALTAEVLSMGYHTHQLVSASRAGPTRFAASPQTVCHVLADDGADSVARVYGDTAGTCRLSATQGTATAALTVTVRPPVVVVVPPPPPPPVDTTPTPVPAPVDTTPTPVPPPPVPAPSDGAMVGGVALPRVVFAPRVAETPSPGRVLRVGADLQAALDSARAGDRVVLPAAATYTGTFIVRTAASASAWLTLTTDAVLPPEGTRIDALAALPTIVQGTADPALTFAQGSRYVRLVGVRVLCTAAYFSACVSGGEPRAAVDAQPSHVVLDRAIVQGSDTSNFTRCVGLHGTFIAVVDSRLLACHGKGRDSQAFWANYGPGPYALLNNTLEGAGENVMVGGDDPASPAHVPSDITIVGNEITTPEAWRGVWTKKNVVELKIGHRVRIEGNVLEGSWADGQIGFCAVLKSNNQGGTAPWGFTSDVVFRANSMARCELGFQLTGKDVGVLDSVTARVLIQQNTYAPTPGAGQRWLQIGQGIRALTLDHNTSLSAASPGILFADSVQAGFVFTGNRVAGSGPYAWAVSSADGHGVGDAALSYHAPGAVVRGNNFVGASTASTPSTNGLAAPDAGADTARVAAIADSVRRGVRVVAP